MNTRDFALTLLAVTIGTTIALAIAGLYLKQQFAASTSSSTTLGSLLSLFSPQTPTPATTT